MRVSSQNLVCTLTLFLLIAPAFAANGSECSAPSQFLRELGLIGKNHQESWDCFIELDDLVDSERIVVDVRTSSDYQSVFFPGSLNMTMDALLVASFKSDPVLVVGYPESKVALANLCARMLSSGFSDSKILLGGIRALAFSKKVLGDPISVEALKKANYQRAAIELISGHAYFIVEGADESLVNQIESLDSQQIIRVKGDESLKEKVFELLNKQTTKGMNSIFVHAVNNPHYLDKFQRVLLVEDPREMLKAYVKLSILKEKMQNAPKRANCKG